jgi:ATP-binding cassette, subfamily B, heavy metal transporter
MSANERQRREFMKVFSLLRSEADRRIVSCALASILVVIASGALVALSPLVLKALVDALDTSHKAVAIIRSPSITSCGVAYLALILAGRVLADIRPLLSGAINQRIDSRLTQRFFDHVLRLPMGYLITRRSGELKRSLDLASAGAQLVISHLVNSLLPVFVEILTMAIVLIRLDQAALVAVFGGATLSYLVIFSTGARWMTQTAWSVSKSSLGVHGQLGENLANLETLRCFSAEDLARRRLEGACGLVEQSWMKMDRLNAAIALAASITFAISMAACLILGMDAVQGHAMSIGAFVLSTVYTIQMVRPLESLGTAARDLSRAVGYMRPLIDLLSQPISELAVKPDANAALAKPAKRCAPTVRLEDLHFAYDPERPVIRGVSLEIPSGSTTAIVGRSGSGKSSLARLLLRLYTPQSGRILLDGRPIETIDAAELRGRLVGLVPQDTALLHDTLAGNIGLGAETPTQESVLLAARGAHLGTLIDALPEGLGTPVGERGMQLSGGERQRVGIARALMRRPGLYVLDEPTSMLDSQTELEIQAALRELSADATIIVIAHRLSTIVDADQIVVLDDGQIRELGSHRALLSKNGLYARMWRQQTAGAT